MLSLGIDPGTASLGYGLARQLDDGSLRLLKYGVIRTGADQAMPDRLVAIHRQIQQLIVRYRPDRGAVEELFFARNVTNAISVAQARGVALMTLRTAGLTVAEYKPHIVKQSITGYGRADKAQMAEMVRLLLGLDEAPRPDDAADALAVAITDLHCCRSPLIEAAVTDGWGA